MGIYIIFGGLLTLMCVIGFRHWRDMFVAKVEKDLKAKAQNVQYLDDSALDK